MLEIFHSGFVGIVGRPNVGKSTLLNHLVGRKVAITSPHPQTTRQRIAGILTTEKAQAVFLDTPGWHRPEHALGQAMFEAAKAVMTDADVLVAVIDGRAGLKPEDTMVFETLKRLKKPVILAVNKVDVTRKPALLPVIEACAALGIFREFIPISAKTGDQVPILLEKILSYLPEGPRWYEPDQYTDQSKEQLTAEFIREKILLVTRQEVPHAVAVRLERMEQGERVFEIEATILVERAGQKAILIGRGGSKLKEIGQAARAEIEKLLGKKIYLGLWVKIDEEWRTNPNRLRELDYPR